MPARIIDGKKIAAELMDSLREECHALQRVGVKPHLVSLQIGLDPAASVYVRNQKRMCAKVGIQYTLESLDEDVTEEEVLARIEELNMDRGVSGILLQMPVPGHLNVTNLQSQIAIHKDIEGVNPTNLGMVLGGSPGLAPCTACAVMHILDTLDVVCRGLEVTIVGHSGIVGKPLNILLLDRLATPTVCHIGTRDLAAHTRKADILVVAVGKAGLVTGDMVKKGAIVIDVGINAIRDKNQDGLEVSRLVGDIIFDEVCEVAAHVTPVPGGVGPVTVALLGKNILQAARKSRELQYRGLGDDWIDNILQGYGYPPDTELTRLIARILHNHIVRVARKPREAEHLHHGLVRDLSRRVIVADGAMGTMLHAQGLDPDVCYESLNLTHAGMVQEIHQAYLDAGSDLLQTNTFGANRYRLEKAGHATELREINIRGVELARRVARKNAYVAGSVGPIAGRRDASLTPAQIREIFQEQIFCLCEGGVDCFVFETFRSLEEMILALEAVREVSDLPVICQMSLLASEEQMLAPFAHVCRRHGAAMMGINCGEGPQQVLKLVTRLSGLTDLKICAKPNAGLPRKVDGRMIYGLSPEEMAQYALKFHRAGVSMFGGCCGTRPDHIQAAAGVLKFKQPVRRRQRT